MAKVEIDSTKMWESILKELWHYPLNSWLVECIKAALKDQGLKYNLDTKKIESVEQVAFKWYVCTKETDGFTNGQIYKVFKDGQGCEWITDNNGHSFLFGYLDSSYFHPATEEEIPHEDYHWNGKIDKKEATSVLKMMVDTVDLEELQKTKAEMLKESSDGELTEFDETFIAFVDSWCGGDNRAYNDCKEQALKDAKELMDLARKQIVSEINVDEMVQKFKDGVEENPHGILACLTLHGAYKLGMDDTLKAIKGE